MIRAAVLALLVAISAAADPSPEYAIGGSASGPAPLSRALPSTASDGTGFFVVWGDYRTEPAGSIVGTRVTSDGQILDPLGIRIRTAGGNASAPQAVWDGVAYLVTWLEDVRGEGTAWHLYAARVARNGTLAEHPRRIAENVTIEGSRYAASNGAVNVVVYRDEHLQLRAAVLDRNLTVLRHETLATGADYPREPAIAAGGSRFVVAWEENSGSLPGGGVIQAVALDANGHRAGAPKSVSRGSQAAIASDGTRFTIASRVYLGWPDFELITRTVSGDLEPLGGEQTLLADNNLRHSNIIEVGGRYEIFAMRNVSSGVQEIVSVAVGHDGTAQGPARVRGTVNGEPWWQAPAAASNGSDVLLARGDDAAPPVGLQIWAQLHRGNATLASAQPQILSWSGNAQRDLSIASGASGFFAAWIEEGGAYATRIDRNGNSLDGRGLALTATPYSIVRTAFDGTNYVVAWRDGGFVGVRYVSPQTGATVAELRLPIPTWPQLALETSADATYLVYIWSGRVAVTRIAHATRTPDSPQLLVSPEEMVISHPAASWNGSELLVVWTEETVLDRADPPISFATKIHAARVSPSLTLLDPAPLLVAAVPGEHQTFGPPAVASNGADWLVVSGFEFTDIVARRVLQNGVVDGSAPVKIGEGIAPAAAWDGRRYAVAWKEGTVKLIERPLALHAVPGAGPLAVTQRTPVAHGTATSAPSIVRAGNGESAVAYTRTSFLAQHAGVERAFFRVMDFQVVRGRVVRR